MPQLDWLNKSDAVRTVKKVPYRLLEAVPELSVGDTNTENMLIQGDNLQALKALLPLYAGKVKCIYIDPPYNTRSAFSHYDDNLEHSLWLSLMYPRLELLRELLAEDGSIWVSIDDNEAHYLKVMMDEVFGRGNLIQSVIWFRKVSPANDAKWFSNDHDHILIYAKNVECLQINKLEREEKHNKAYKNPDNDFRGDWNSVTLTGNKNSVERPNLFYPIINPNTGEELYPPKGLTWRTSKDNVEDLISNNLIYWGKDGTSRSPRLKRFLDEAKPVIPRSVWHYDDTGHTQEGMLESKGIFDIPFGTPKPERLLYRILQIATNENDLILDSFLGSGTTAAVAHKMNRRYIGIEMGDHAQTHCQPRLKKVVEGEQGGISKAVNWQGGGGFHYFRLGETIFDEVGSIHHNVRFAALAAHIWFCETRIPLASRADSPLLGVHNDTAYYLLYNGILGDRRPQSGNVLTQAVLDSLPKHNGRKIIYGEASRFGKPRLEAENIVFKQIPYDVRAV